MAHLVTVPVMTRVVAPAPPVPDAAVPAVVVATIPAAVLVAAPAVVVVATPPVVAVVPGAVAVTVPAVVVAAATVVAVGLDTDGSALDAPGRRRRGRRSAAGAKNRMTRFPYSVWYYWKSSSVRRTCMTTAPASSAFTNRCDWPQAADSTWHLHHSELGRGEK